MSSIPQGVILWDGASQLDGAPIVVIATGFYGSRNVKTGPMVQTWILRRDVDPVSAVQTGQDSSVCGDCPLRGMVQTVKLSRDVSVNGRPISHHATYERHNKGRCCYVNVGQAPLAVWRAYHRGSYVPYDPSQHARLFQGRRVRIGSYGDPVAAPYRLWREVSTLADSHTGYTHSWRQGRFWRFRSLLMASCETLADCRVAWSRGWRSFRSMVDVDDRTPLEILCPASDEAGKRTTCERCQLCHGAGSPKSVAIVAHGSRPVVANYRRHFTTA